MMKIRRVTASVVLTGKDRGKEGDVTLRLPRRGQGHRRRRQHRQEAPEADPGHHAGRHHRQGHAASPVSNVAVLCPSCGKPTRVGYRFDADGTKVRICNEVRR